MTKEQICQNCKHWNLEGVDTNAEQVFAPCDKWNGETAGDDKACSDFKHWGKAMSGEPQDWCDCAGKMVDARDCRDCQDGNYFEDCPHCGGEGYLDDECECERIADQCFCETPTPRSCDHCNPNKRIETGGGE